jgi:hypothetical protein
MARNNKGRSAGRIAMPLAVTCAALGLVAGLVTGASVAANMRDVDGRGWMIVLVVAAIMGAVGGVVGWVVGGKIGSRLTDLGLAVSKLGRGGTEVRVRFGGNDEIAALGRSLQYLANDLAELLGSADDSGGGALATMDPQVRQLRDRALSADFPDLKGYELDGALSAGSRGGLDYFDIVEGEKGVVLYLVSAEGQGPMSVVACRLARDEIDRALQQKAMPRKALSHANRVLKRVLPTGSCAKATLLQVAGGQAKLYQAGARSPLLICRRGEVLELSAEGLALGLDDGPVFDKALRPEEIGMTAGTRLLVVNEATLRVDGILDRIEQHSPRHTAMFMNMLLGGIEQDAGDGGLREDVVILSAKCVGEDG